MATMLGIIQAPDCLTTCMLEEYFYTPKHSIFAHIKTFYLICSWRNLH